MRVEQIGNCRLILADCMDVLPTLGKVDAVVDNINAVVFNGEYESASRKHSEKSKSPSSMGSPSRRHNRELCERQSIANGDGRTLSGDPDGFPEGYCSDGNSAEIEGQGWQGERALQGRNPEHGLSQHDRKEALQQVWGNQQSCDSPQRQCSHEQCARELGSAVQSVPQQPPQARMVELPKGWGIVIDPPYGINAGHGIGRSDRIRVGKNKKNWDDRAPDISMLVNSGAPMVVWGGNYFGLPASRGFLIWDKNNSGRDFADCEMAWTNQDSNARLKTLRPMNMDGGKVHPTQKPVAIMEWSIAYLPHCHTILDCFMGSGTTGVACVKMGRKFIGIEREESYFNIACRRIEEAYKQPDMFIQQPAAMVQEPLL